MPYAWTDLSSASPRPSNRYAMCMAWDYANDNIVCFAGIDGSFSSTYDETWTIDPATKAFTLQSPAHRPGNPVLESEHPAGGVNKMCWDGTRVIYTTSASVGSSGFDPPGPEGPWTMFQQVAKTWGWDGTDWTLLDTTVSYDDFPLQIVWTGEYVLGIGKVTWTFTSSSDFSFTYHPATYKWDGSSWTTLSSTIEIDSYQNVGRLASNGTNTYYFGEIDITSDPPADNNTLKWHSDTEEWELLSPAHSPPGRIGSGFAWSDLNNSFVLFGGNDNTSPFYHNDTWLWDETDWTQIFPVANPSIRSGVAMCDVPGEGPLQFGGIASGPGYKDGLWQLDELPIYSAPARATAYFPAPNISVATSGISLAGTHFRASQ